MVFRQSPQLLHNRVDSGKIRTRPEGNTAKKKNQGPVASGYELTAERRNLSQPLRKMRESKKREAVKTLGTCREFRGNLARTGCNVKKQVER